MNSLVRNKGRLTIFVALAAFTVLALPAPEAAAADHARYVLFSSGTDSVSMSGSTDDITRARELRRGNEALLYARVNGVAYIIRDPETLRAAAAIFKPQAELGSRQAELGSRQAALGSQQAALGAKQAHLGALQADARPSEQDALGRQQDELGKQQDALGRQQDELGKQQDALGREQERLGQIATEKFDALLADAMRKGLAQRVN